MSCIHVRCLVLDVVEYQVHYSLLSNHSMLLLFSQYVCGYVHGLGSERGWGASMCTWLADLAATAGQMTYWKYMKPKECVHTTSGQDIKL